MDFNPIQYNLENEDRHLLEYLPPALRQVLDFQQINAAAEPEIRLAWQGLARVLGNQFLEEADAAGLAVWERELGVYPKAGEGLAVWERELGVYPKAGEGLAVRRARIKAGWMRKPPYTLRWLREWLDSLGGADGHSETVEGYTLNIQLDYDLLPEPNKLVQEILALLLSIRPANLLVQIEAQAAADLPAYAGAAACGFAFADGAAAQMF